MLETLRSIYNYNPLTGAITHLTHRGPKKPGDSAIATWRSRPILYIKKKPVPAATIAWLLHTGSDELFPIDTEPRTVSEWLEIERQEKKESTFTVWCKDGNLFNLAFSNLEVKQGLQPLPELGKRKRLKKVSDTGIKKRGRGWQVIVNHNGKPCNLGTFPSIYDARIARQAAMADIKAGREPIKNTRAGRPALEVGDRSIAYDIKRRLIINPLSNREDESDTQKTLDEYGVYIDDLPHRDATFDRVPVGSKFYYIGPSEINFFMKVSGNAAVTIDKTRNRWQQFKPKARVKYITEFRFINKA